MEGMDSCQFDFIQSSMRRLRKGSLIIYLLCSKLVAYSSCLVWDQNAQGLEISATEEFRETSQLICIIEQQ